MFQEYCFAIAEREWKNEMERVEIMAHKQHGERETDTVRREFAKSKSKSKENEIKYYNKRESHLRMVP